jgi:hypothetical protein
MLECGDMVLGIIPPHPHLQLSSNLKDLMQTMDVGDVGIAGDGDGAPLGEGVGGSGTGGLKGQESGEAAIKVGLGFRIRGGSAAVRQEQGLDSWEVAIHAGFRC